MILTQNLNLGYSQPFLHQYSLLNIIPHTSIHTCLVYSYLGETKKLKISEDINYAIAI